MKIRARHLWWSLLVLGIALPASAADLEPSPSPSPDPVVEIRAPGSYRAKKIGYFPLEIPAYTLRGITYPLHGLAKVMERKHVIEKLSRYYLKHKIIFFPIIQAGGGGGFGGGFGFRARDMAGSGYDFALDYTIFNDLDQRTGFSLSSRDYFPGEHPFRFKFSVRYRDKTDSNFFGVGPGSLKVDESEFGFTRFLTGVTMQYEPLEGLTLSMPLEFMTVKTKPEDDLDKPSVQQMFPPSELVGFEDRTNYAVFGLEVEHDTRDAKINASQGGYQSFRIARFQGLGTDRYSFIEMELDVRQYIRLWTPRHVLVVRNDWVFQDGTGSAGVPFNLLTTLDVNSPLRGFTSGRFHDRSSVLFNFEYRFPIWDYIAGDVFVDTGKVFNGIKHFNFDDWRYSVGGGIRVFFRDNFLMGIQAGYGGEGAVVTFRLGEAL